jgi:hypothetical protein
MVNLWEIIGDKNSAEKRNEIYSGEIFNKIRVYELLVYGDTRNILWILKLVTLHVKEIYLVNLVVSD